MAGGAPLVRNAARVDAAALAVAVMELLKRAALRERCGDSATSSSQAEEWLEMLFLPRAEAQGGRPSRCARA